MQGTKHFKSKLAYMKWISYGHMHKKFVVPGVQKIVIAGKPHAVKHRR
jgi:hypothetical protein